MPLEWSCQNGWVDETHPRFDIDEAVESLKFHRNKAKSCGGPKKEFRLIKETIEVFEDKVFD